MIMQQSVTANNVGAGDNNQRSLTGQGNAAKGEYSRALAVTTDKAFELQEKWINVIAHCPLLSPDHLWKDSSLQIRIGFIPAEPKVDGEEKLINLLDKRTPQYDTPTTRCSFN